MKRIVSLSIALGLLALAGTSNAQIAKWTFENLTISPANTNATSMFGVAAEVGTGTASSVHATSATFSTPVGNGSAKSASANGFSIGDYWQFQTSTLGSSGIQLTWDQTSSNTGPGKNTLQYSTDGTTFTQFGSEYTILANATPNPTWSSGTPQPIFTFTVDLSSVPALNNAAAVYFRLVDSQTTSANGGIVAATGTDRVDNFTVAVVPEPTGLFLLGGLGILGLCFKNRRK